MAKHSTQKNIEEAAARMGFVMRRMPPDFHRVQWVLKCSACSREHATPWGGGMPPEAMAAQMRRKQWDVDIGMRPLCPSCKVTHKAPKKKPEHQNFNRWVPPESMIFDRLLDAANKRAKLAMIPKAIETLVQVEQQLEAVAKEKRVLQADLAAAERLEAQRARVAKARQARLDRIHREDRERAQRAEHLAEELARQGTNVIAINEAPQAYAQAPQAEKETDMKPNPAPSPKITHTVFQHLDDVFDAERRLYKNGYSDQRVARDCGTTEEIVAWLRSETFGELAEDPRLGNIRDDLELLRMESAETFAKLQKQIAEIANRVEQIARQ